MLINTYIEVQSLYSGTKKLQHVELYAELKPVTNEVFYKIKGMYCLEQYAILITTDREEATIMFYNLCQKLIDKQLEEAEERQKSSA